jgi:hypothetical protein
MIPLFAKFFRAQVSAEVDLNSRLALLVLFAALALAACGTTARHKLDLPRDEVAEVRGLEERRTFGMGRELAFQAVDGKEFGSGFFSELPREIDVLPGKHKLRCVYLTTYDGVQGPSGTVDVDLDAVAGAVYRCRYDFGSRGEIVVRFTALSKEDAAAAHAKEREDARVSADNGS